MSEFRSISENSQRQFIYDEYVECSDEKSRSAYQYTRIGSARGRPFAPASRGSGRIRAQTRCGNACRAGWGGFAIKKTGADTYRVSGGNDRRGEVGDYVVWGMPPPKGAVEGDHVSERDVVYCRATVRCVFENIVEYATPGGRAFEEHLAEANEYRNCQIVCRPPETDFMKRGLKRLRSGNHDAFNSRCSYKGPTLDGCTGADLRGNEIALPPDSKKQAIELRNVVDVLR